MFISTPGEVDSDIVHSLDKMRVPKDRNLALYVALSLLVLCGVLPKTLAHVEAELVGDKAGGAAKSLFDLEYGKHIVDLNTVVYCSDGSKVQDWSCPVCNKPRVKDFEVDDVIHEFEINIMAYTGYSPSLGKCANPSHPPLGF